MAESRGINNTPVTLENGLVTVIIKVKPIYKLIDGKAVNAIMGT